MSYRFLAAAAAVACLGLTASTAHAQTAHGQTANTQTARFVGQWHWNRTDSTSLVSNEPAPQDVVLSIAAAEPGRVQWTLTALDAKGDAHLQSYSGRGDGSAAQIAGASDGAMAAFTVTAAAFRGVYSNRDGSSERTACAVTGDGRRMTCDGTEIDAKGRTRNYVDVYDRR